MTDWYWDNKSQDFYKWEELPYKKDTFWVHDCWVDGCKVVSELEKPCCSCKKEFDKDLKG